MEHTPEDFIKKYKDGLIQTIQGYLDKNVSHHEIKEYVWVIIDDWNRCSEKLKTKSYVKGERAFWAIVWEVATGTDEKDLKDDYLQGALRVLLECFKKMGDLPCGYNARRPLGDK